MDAPLQAWFDRANGCEAYAGHWSSFATRHHAHAGYQVTCADRGLGWIDCEGRRLPLAAGEIAVVPPGAVHAIGADTAAWSFRALLVPESAFEGRRVATGPWASGGARAAFAQLHGAIRDLGDAGQHLHRLGRALGTASSVGIPGDAAPVSAQVSCMRDHLDAVLDRPVPLAELADLAGGSPTHVARRFGREVGLPPHAYHLQARIANAKVLLGQGMTPGAAALAAGFSDQSHFNRHFVRVVGMTPGGFRRAAVRKNVQDPA